MLAAVCFGQKIAPKAGPVILSVTEAVKLIDPAREPVLPGAKLIVATDAVKELARKDTVKVPVYDPKKPDSIIRYDTVINNVPERIRRDAIRLGLQDMRALQPGDTITIAIYYGKTAKGVDSIWIRHKTYIDPVLYPKTVSLKPLLKCNLIEVAE